MILNTKQQLALDAFKDFLLNDDAFIYILEGYSGCGKSTITKQFIEEGTKLLNFAISLSPEFVAPHIAITATTNQAANNLKAITNYDVTTVHSYFGLTLRNNYQTGEKDLVTTRNTIKQYQVVLFIDEASYITQEDLDILFQWVDKASCKIVFIGDPCQLLGNDEGIAPAFDLETEYHFYLDEVMRQGSDSKILDFAEEHREAIINKVNYLPEIYADNKTLCVVNGPQFQTKVDELFKTDPQGQRVLAYTNATVIDYNEYIREQLGYADNQFRKGELVISNGVIKNKKNTVSIRNNARLIINEFQGKVTYSKPVGDIEITLECYKYLVRSVSGVAATIFAPADTTDYLNTVRELRDMAKNNKKYWSVYFDLTSTIADLRPAYSSTVHKAQGMTLTNALLDMNDIDNAGYRSVDTALRLRYVGVTRAANTAYLYYSEDY